MECSICLLPMNQSGKQTNKPLITLSCNHQLHYQCFISYALKTKGHTFIKCPLCREMNLNNEKPTDDPESNIRILLNHVKSKRCCHETKSGFKCKNKASLMNYGYCAVHHNELLPKEKYPAMCTYLYYILQTPNTWYTKVFLIDIVKKLLIKYPEIDSLEQIHHYMLRFKFHRHENKDVISPPSAYQYYELNTAPPEWTHKCIGDRTLI